MATIEYRLFFNNNPASREQLDRVEEITVEQEVGLAWEGCLQIPAVLDAKGNWLKETEAFMSSFSRARVEIRVGGDFVPLIDGPVVGFDSPRYAEPGQSRITMLVRDDSVELNREEVLAIFENLRDDEIAAQIFEQFAQIAATDIESTPAASVSPPPAVVQRGTAMQFLRFLAKRQGMHAYVLPGSSPGQSLGCFKAFPIRPGGLPPLILLGADRNLADFDTRNDALRPSRVRAATLNLSDKTVTSKASRFSEVELMGDQTTFAKEGDTGRQLLSPYRTAEADLDQIVFGEAADSTYALEATGTVLGFRYRGVLGPYQVVTVKGGKSSLSGDYLISKVTHTLTRSYYSQTFSARRNAQSESSPGSLADLAGSIF
jgi:hypothetical protein